MPAGAAGQGQFQAVDGRAYAEFDGTYVADVVYLEQGQRLAVAFQQVAGLVRQESVRAATERGHLHTLHVVAFTGYPLRGAENTVRVGPL